MLPACLARLAATGQCGNEHAAVFSKLFLEKHEKHEPAADRKIREIVRRLDLPALTETEFVRDLGHMIASTRADCSCKVAMGLTCLICSEKKKLISHESVKTLRRAA